MILEAERQLYRLRQLAAQMSAEDWEDAALRIVDALPWETAAPVLRLVAFARELQARKTPPKDRPRRSRPKRPDPSGRTRP